MDLQARRQIFEVDVQELSWQRGLGLTWHHEHMHGVAPVDLQMAGGI
jgi:hypothetical protein